MRPSVPPKHVGGADMGMTVRDLLLHLGMSKSVDIGGWFFPDTSVEDQELILEHKDELNPLRGVSRLSLLETNDDQTMWNSDHYYASAIDRMDNDENNNDLLDGWSKDSIHPYILLRGRS